MATGGGWWRRRAVPSPTASRLPPRFRSRSRPAGRAGSCCGAPCRPGRLRCHLASRSICLAPCSRRWRDRGPPQNLRQRTPPGWGDLPVRRQLRRRRAMARGGQRRMLRRRCSSGSSRSSSSGRARVVRPGGASGTWSRRIPGESLLRTVHRASPCCEPSTVRDE